MVYQFTCDCKNIYIGQTKRFLRIRAEDHQRASSGSHVFSHITDCTHYIKKAHEYALNQKDKFTSPPEAILSYVKSRFSIIAKGFRNDYERRRCEAYHIRLKRLKINDPKYLKAFGLF